MHSIKRDSASGKLLKMFVLNRDAFLSGEDAAQKLGVSRTAVWKAVEALRKEGFEIEGSTNKGYRLRRPCEVLHPALIESALEPFALSVCAGKIEVFDSIDSTNTEAKRRLSAAMDCAKLHGAVIIAETQSAGRGRFAGRVFYSPAKSGVYLSLVFCPFSAAQDKAAVPDPSVFTALTAAAVCRAFGEFGFDGKIKWVNDIFVNGKKVCGILSEGVISMERKAVEAVVIGIGVNVRESGDGFPEALKNKAGALTGKTCGPDSPAFIDRNELTASILSHTFSALYGRVSAAELLEEYRSRSFIIGKYVEVAPQSGKPYRARVCGITAEARLIIERDGGTREELSSGEISLLFVQEGLIPDVSRFAPVPAL